MINLIKQVISVIVLGFAVLDFSSNLCLAKKTGCNEPRVLVVSFDGFRWNYLDKVPTPNFDRVWKGGVRAKWIKNVFVTKTLPNHYAMMTGLYEESHGITSNKIYDPVWNETFELDKYVPHGGEWFGGEPIWVTNQMQGKTHKSGLCFWPFVDSNVPIKGVKATFFERFNMTAPFRDRVDIAVSWLKEGGMNLGLLHFYEPDYTGHFSGPESQKMIETLKECDSVMGYLLDQLENAGLSDSINLIVTSDHGMVGYTENMTIYLDDHIPPELYFTVDGRPFRHIWPKEGQKEHVYNKLKVIPHLNVYYKEEIPEKYHYKNNRRVGPIFIITDLGWQLATNRNITLIKGDHGWSNDYTDMHPFFLARGPAFKKNIVSEPFNNIDIYPLLCHILKLTPAPNNGSLENVKHLLGDGLNLPSTISTFVIVFIIIGGLGGMFIIGACLQLRQKPTHIIAINSTPSRMQQFESATLLTDDDDEVETGDTVP